MIHAGKSHTHDFSDVFSFEWKLRYFGIVQMFEVQRFNITHNLPLCSLSSEAIRSQHLPNTSFGLKSNDARDDLCAHECLKDNGHGQSNFELE